MNRGDVSLFSGVQCKFIASVVAKKNASKMQDCLKRVYFYEQTSLIMSTLWNYKCSPARSRKNCRWCVSTQRQLMEKTPSILGQEWNYQMAEERHIGSTSHHCNTKVA